MINNVININVDYTEMGVKPSPRQTTLTTYILDKGNIMDSGGIEASGGYSMSGRRI